jgi:serine/threonine-protein kinase RsbW
VKWSFPAATIDPCSDGGRMKRHRSKLKLSGDTIPWTCQEFHSCLHQARTIEATILAECAKHNFGRDDIFAIKLALEEALVNAVKHGNKMDPNKVVHVQYLISDQRADITVEDQGQGFNPAELPDPTCDENLELSSGRGILLMRAYMSSVVFNPTGNKVTLTKFNESYEASGRNAAMG